METKTVLDAFGILMKFGTKENLEKLQNGEVFMHSLEWYRSREKNDNDDTCGDLLEAILRLHDVKVKFNGVKGIEDNMEIKCQTIQLDPGIEKNPVFCLFRFDYRNSSHEEIQEKEDNDLLTVICSFTDEQKKKMIDFDSWVLVIDNSEEFFKRLVAALRAENTGYIKGGVKYYQDNDLEQVIDVLYNDSNHIAFWKREKYAYQQEFRFMPLRDAKYGEYDIVNIGDIHDITHLCKAEEVFELELQGQFTLTKEKEIQNENGEDKKNLVI